MSTQNEATAYLSELLKTKDLEVQTDEARVKELAMALEQAKAQLKKSTKEKELLALAEQALRAQKPSEPDLKVVESEPEPSPEPIQEVPVQEKSTPSPEPPPQKKRGRPKGSKNSKSKDKKPEATRQITRGARPPLKKSMHEILGTDNIMSAPEMVEALGERDCLPQSTNPQSIVSWMFSKNRDAFVRVSHGKYRANLEYNPRNTSDSELTTEEVNSELSDMGLGDIRRGVRIENPFQS